MDKLYWTLGPVYNISASVSTCILKIVKVVALYMIFTMVKMMLFWLN